MASVASFKLLKCTSADAGVETDSNKEVFLLSEDTSAANTNFPILIPRTVTESPNYSAESWLRLEMTAKPNNRTENFKCWGPATPPSDYVRMLIGTTSVGRKPSTADSVSTACDGGPYPVGYVATAHYSAGTAVEFTGDTVDDYIDDIGEQSEFLILQLEVDYGALSGNIETQTFSISYDES